MRDHLSVHPPSLDWVYDSRWCPLAYRGITPTFAFLFIGHSLYKPVCVQISPVFKRMPDKADGVTLLVVTLHLNQQSLQRPCSQMRAASRVVGANLNNCEF